MIFDRTAIHLLFRGKSCLPRKACVLVLLLLAGSAGCSKSPENVIIISMDTLNRSSLRAFDPGAPALPAIETFAENAAVFNRAYTTSSWTLPAHGSLLTGRYPNRHGATNPQLGLAGGLATLAGSLREAGFETVAFTDGGNMSWQYGFSQGFDRYDEKVDPDSGMEHIRLPREGKSHPVPGVDLFDRGIRYLTARKERRGPFFLFLHSYLMHNYFMLNSWAVDSLPPYPDKEGGYYLDCILGRELCSGEDWDRMRALYRAELLHMDRAFDRLMGTIEEQGLRESTIVIFLSDHGEGFDPDRGRIHHGGRLHEDQVRIPLLLSGPGVRKGRYETQASLVDIMPTVLRLLDVDPAPYIDGRSLAALLRGREEPEPRALFAQEYFYWWEEGKRYGTPSPGDTPRATAVIRGEEWYIRDRQGEELYSMSDDPLQRKNLSGDSAALAELRSLAESGTTYRSSAPAVIQDKALEDKLRSLGYVR